MKKYKLKKNVNVKNNYRKIKKKQDNDVNADLAQQGCSNNKCYTSAFIYIQMCIETENVYNLNCSFIAMVVRKN